MRLNAEILRAVFEVCNRFPNISVCVLWLGNVADGVTKNFIPLVAEIKTRPANLFGN
jgi:hypothetical protein